MAIFEIKNLKFSYPEQEREVLKNLNLQVNHGDFLILCGLSGCGKSTLLRHLKSVLAPHGNKSGEIIFDGQDLDQVDIRKQASQIGFVFQSPDNQIVTDKVWHELAFGMESLGFDTPTIRRRVAEMAAFFGIEDWFYKDVSSLSGGQKQLLNLASVMVLQPKVLVLDEPTGQLDPIAASDFLETVGRINRELATTVILTEHRLEEAFPLANRVAVMEDGAILCQGSPSQVGQILREKDHSMFLAMPSSMRIWASVDTEADCPVTVREGREFVEQHIKENGAKPIREEHIAESGQPVIKVKDAWFRYEKNLPDVIKGLNLTLGRGEFFVLLGGNGVGKSTSLGLISGTRKAYRGKLDVDGKKAVLPQNPQTLFVKKTVVEDLEDVSKDQARMDYVIELCMLGDFLDRHPFDLSGGEQQRLALAKLLLLEPEILLLDEPTKGLDAAFKTCFAGILNNLIDQGVSILMVSHDIEFCAKYAHRCALFFDGNIIAEGSPREFFSGNSFYTTSANRIARNIEDKAVTAEDVMTLIGGRLPAEAKPPKFDINMPAPKRDRKESSGPEKEPGLPLWRKIIASMSAIVSLVLFIKIIRVTDLSQIIGDEGLTPQGLASLPIYLAFICSLFILAASISRKTKKKAAWLQVSKEDRRLSKRTIFASILVILLAPLTLLVGVFYLDKSQYNIVSLLVLVECMAPFFMIFEGKKPQARELVIIAVLAAIAIAGRAAFFMLPQFKPVMAIVIISGVAFGGETGFLVGAISMLASNVLFGQGPWTAWQMFCMGIIGFIAGVLFRKGLLLRGKLSLAIFGAVAAILIYGGIINFGSAIMALGGNLNGKVILSYYLTGFPMDCIHASATALFLYIGAEPMLEKLDRIKVKYGLVEREHGRQA